MSSEAPYFKLSRPSRSSGKKWQVRVPTRSGRGKTVAFGDASMEDYTIHKDKARRENYRSRHRKDRIYDPYAPGFWSWWSLWGESSDLKKAHALAVRMAKKLLKKQGVDVGRSNPAVPPPTMADVSQVVAALGVPKNLRAEFLAGFGVEWEHAESVGYDLQMVGRIVLDHLAENPRYYRQLKRRTNPQPSARVRSCFDALFAVVREQYPNLECSLVVSEDAGLRGGERCTRAYAYCAELPDGGYAIHVAPKMDDADDSRIDGLMRHELSHAVLLHTGDVEHTERDADEIAEDLFGAPLYYDADDVQTTDPSAPGARRPRPAYLDDESGRTLDSAHPIEETWGDVEMRANGETMRLETTDDVLEALDNAAATGDHKTPRIIASQLSQQAKEVAGAQSRMLLCLARAARHCANAVEARLAGNIEHAMSCERLCERAIGEAREPKAVRRNGEYNSPDYKFYIIQQLDDGQVIIGSGWDYKEDAYDALQDQPDFAGLRVVAKRTLKSMGCDPEDDAYWQKFLSRENPEWAKKLGRGLYKGARYAGETARDLYQGAREAHGEYDEAEEHEADEDVLPGDERHNPEWAKKLGRAVGAPRRAKERAVAAAAVQKEKAKKRAAESKAAWAARKAKAREYYEEVKRDFSEGVRSNPPRRRR